MPAATCTGSAAAVGSNRGGSNKSAYKQDSGCDYEDDAFHDGFSLLLRIGP
jgi:hypothetical protein